MRKQNLRSEAAIKQWMRMGEIYKHMVYYEGLIRLYRSAPDGMYLLAEIDLHDLIKKRKPLTGIKKQMAEIVSGKKKVKK
jgi:hypothetical protein